MFGLVVDFIRHKIGLATLVICFFVAIKKNLRYVFLKLLILVE